MNDDLQEMWDNWEFEQFDNAVEVEDEVESDNDFDNLSDDDHFHDEWDYESYEDGDCGGDEDEDFIDLSDLFDDLEG